MAFYDSIGGEVKKFALPSMYNYLYSVLSLLDVRDYEAFRDWRIAVYSGLGGNQLVLNNADKQFLFEQFFFGYKLMNNVKLISELPEEQRVPYIQLGGMAFYYASYSFAACFIYLHNRSVLATHSKTYRNYDIVCDKLAFPFNVTFRYDNASWNTHQIINGSSEFLPAFTYDKQILNRTALNGFDYKSGVLSYLIGTNRWYWEESPLFKEAMKEVRRAGYQNFRTRAARQIRDTYFSRMPNANYLSCLYRLRGKLNYRDSLFSLYDLRNMGFNTYAKATRLLDVMLEVLKYFSLDIEAYFKVRLMGNNFHKNMLEDMITQTDGFSFSFPEFQKNIFYPIA